MQDIGIERAILAGICQFGLDGYVKIQDLLQVSTFTDQKNQLLFVVLQKIFNSGIEAVDIAGITTYSNSLGYQDQLLKNNTDQEYIRSLFNFPIKQNNLRQYALKLFNLQSKRVAKELLKALYDEVDDATNLEEVLKITDKASNELLKKFICAESDTIGSDAIDYVEYLKNNPIDQIGIPTPFPVLNSTLGGGLRNGVTVIAARSKAGKSFFGINTALHTSMQGIPTLYIDTEMSKEEQLHRILANLSGIKTEDIETGKFGKNPMHTKRVKEAATKLKDIPFTHQNVSGKSFDDIMSIMKRWLHNTVGYNDDGKPKRHVIVYDYLKLTNSSTLNIMGEHQAFGFQMAALHDFCKINNTPILGFVQLNREGIQSDSESAVSQSDRIVWNAIALCIYRKKSPEEIGVDGPENGNMKLTPILGRFMIGLNDGDYINYRFSGSIAKIEELKTRNDSQKTQETVF